MPSAIPPFTPEESARLTQIWDLCHYGFPTYLHPFSEDFVKRFADYCYAFARFLIRRTGAAGTRFYTPLNEPSFYAWAGGVMVRDLAPKVGQPGVWLEQSHLDDMRGWTERWRRRAGLAGG